MLTEMMQKTLGRLIPRMPRGTTVQGWVKSVGLDYIELAEVVRTMFEAGRLNVCHYDDLK